MAPTSCFQVDQPGSEHQIFGFPNWIQHSSKDYECTSYSLHSTKVDTLEFEKSLFSESHHTGKLYYLQHHGTTYNVGQSPRKVYTKSNDWYATTFGMVRKIMQLGPRVAWPILTSPKARGGLGLIDPLSQSKPYLPNLWCEDSNQGMTAGKSYCGYASLTLGHEKGPIAPPPNGMDSKHGSQT